jgi:hypothetical protein
MNSEKSRIATNYMPEVVSDLSYDFKKILIVPTRATLSVFTEGKALALEEFEYALESWSQTPATAGVGIA